MEKIFPLSYLWDVIKGVEPLTEELAETIWELRVGKWRYLEIGFHLCGGEGDDRKVWRQIGQQMSNLAVRFLGKLNERPELNQERCLQAAQGYCCYYEKTFARETELGSWDSEQTQYWNEKKQIVEEWQRLLFSGSFDERRIAALEVLLAAKWGEEHAGSAWMSAAPSIDAWLRSLGRPGLGDNPWYGGSVFSDVMVLDSPFQHNS